MLFGILITFGFLSRDVEQESKSTISTIKIRQQYNINNFCHYNAEPSFISTIDNPVTFAEWLISSVQVHDQNMDKVDMPSTQTFHTKERKMTTTATDLSERWFIGLKQAEKTIRATTQRLL